MKDDEFIHVEWIDGDKARDLFKKRRKKEIYKIKDMFPDRSELEIVSPEEEDSIWDWVEMEECVVSRSFTAVDKAMKWAERNAKLDVFGTPRLFHIKICDDEFGEVETLMEMEYQGNGEWTNLETGLPVVRGI